MKFLICAVLCLILSSAIAAAEHFELKDGTGTICILSDFEAHFNLTLTYKDKTHTKSFDLEPVASVNVSGSCANQSEEASLILTTVKDVLGFIVTSANDVVSADLTYVLGDAETLFPGINYTDAVTFNGEGAEFPNMGSDKTSYKCLHQETFALKSNDTNVTATIDITFSDFQLQAFNVDKKYSTNITECDGDTTSTTSTPTTTMTPATGRGNYSLENNGTICLHLLANITLEIKMNDTIKMVRVPADAMVSGTCGSDEEKPMMTLTFEDEDEEVIEMEAKTGGSLTFHFTKNQNYAIIEIVDFEITFSNATNMTVKASAEVNDVLSKTSNSYTCAEENLVVGVHHVVLQDVQVQAFGLMGEKFAKGVDCADAAKAPTDSNYTVTAGNVTCISITGALQLMIPYVTTTANVNGSQMINFTNDQPTEGSCSTGNDSMSEHIIIKFHKNDFSIRFDFAKEGTSSSLTADEKFNYFVQNITVMYTLNNEFFPDAKDPQGGKTVGDKNQMLYKTASNMYYKCDTDQTITLPDGVNLMTKDFKFVAFHTADTPPDLSSDSANECAADTETNSIVPIAVGAALAGLVVIVLIAYLIGRRRNHKGYESV